MVLQVLELIRFACSFFQLIFSDFSIDYVQTKIVFGVVGGTSRLCLTLNSVSASKAPSTERWFTEKAAVDAERETVPTAAGMLRAAGSSDEA